MAPAGAADIGVKHTQFHNACICVSGDGPGQAILNPVGPRQVTPVVSDRPWVGFIDIKQKYNSMNNMREISSKLLEELEVNKLPSLPHVLIRLLQACRDESVCFDSIADIISKDVALCAKVIAVANSPIYGHVRHQNNLKHILLSLGLDTIKSIAITASVQQFFSKYSSKKIHFLKQFWRHALSCATIAKSLARLTGYKYVEEAYIAGLLHDIGKLVLANYAGSDYGDYSHGTHPADELLVLEGENFAISHDELGARLLARWDVTEAICDAVRFHHKPLEDIQAAHQLVKILNLSNILASRNILHDPQGIGCATGFFDLTDSIIRDIILQSEAEVLTVARSMNIDIGNGDTAGDSRDEQKQIELAQEVRDVALSRSSQLHGCQGDLTSVYQSIQKSIVVLFGIKECIIFNCNHPLRLLTATVGCSVYEQSLINDLAIPFESGSVLSQAVTSRKIKSSFQAEKQVVVDQQIIGFMKTEGFICIPAVRDEQVIALIVIGVNNIKYLSLLRSHKLLTLFAQDAASQIELFEAQARMQEEILNNSHNLYREKAREIIHETNNPLSVIRNYLQLLAQRLDGGDPAQDDIRTIKEEIDRVGTIILRCADEVSLDKAAASSGLEINELVTDINNIFKSSLYITHNIESSLHLDNATGFVHANKNAVKQILTNIIKNAVEAMNAGGTLDISTRNININGRNFVDIEIRDTGPGIPDGVLKHLYAPVQSSKGKDHSGLGLSIVKSLMDRMDGFIGCKTGASGTVFNIQLPGNLKK